MPPAECIEKTMDEEPAQLSKREREILNLVASGSTNQQIANDLGISVNTVKVHLRNVFSKVGAASRTEATMYAVRTGIVKPEPERAPLDHTTVSLSSEPAEVLPPPAPETAVREEALHSLIKNARAPQESASLNSSSEEVFMPSKKSAAPRARRKAPPHYLYYLSAAAVILLALVALLIWQNQSASSTTGGPSSAEPAQRIESIPTPQWITHTSLNTLQTSAAATSLNGSIFLIGGRTTEGVTGQVWRYDPENDTWRALTTKTTPVSHIQAVALNGKIYVVGGELSDGSVSDVVEVYDPVQGTWSSAAPLPAPRSAYALAALEGQIYLFGGTDGTQAQADVYAYNPTTDSWSTQTPMPTPRMYHQAATLDGKIYVVGGENDSGQLTANERYFPADEGSQPWVSRAPLPQPRSRFGVGSINNDLFLFGGTPAEDVVTYDIRADIWRSLQLPPSPLGVQLAVAQRDESLFLIHPAPGQSSTALLEFRLIYTINLPLR